MVINNKNFAYFILAVIDSDIIMIMVGKKNK